MLLVHSCVHVAVDITAYLCSEMRRVNPKVLKLELIHSAYWYVTGSACICLSFGAYNDKIRAEKLRKRFAALEEHRKKADKGDAESSSKKAISGQKTADKSNGSADSKKPAGELPENKENPTAAGNNKTSGEKKKVKEKSAGKTAEKAPEKVADKESECNISILNIQVGLIRKAWKHPSADSLLVEEIDLGDGNVRQVVSGLAKYCSPDDLTNRHVVLVTNVEPGKLQDVMSAGLVLCASTEDHTAVEPLIPPEGAKIGEHISFAGFVGKPEDVLNPKKKQLDKITPYLRTDENGIATFKGVPFTTSAGPCRSSIRSGNVK